MSTTHNILVGYTRSDISGNVKDILTKQPLAGIRVWVEGGESKYFATTDSAGNYEIRKVPSTARILNLKASATYATNSRKIDPLPQPGVDVPHQGLSVDSERVQSE